MLIPEGARIIVSLFLKLRANTRKTDRTEAINAAKITNLAAANHPE
jgi:hypothetical protein